MSYTLVFTDKSGEQEKIVVYGYVHAISMCEEEVKWEETEWVKATETKTGEVVFDRKGDYA
jgi:hypothetical protein